MLARQLAAQTLLNSHRPREHGRHCYCDNCDKKTNNLEYRCTCNMQRVEDRRRLKRRYNYDRSHRWKDPSSLWLCPKAGGFQRRPSTGILQGIQSVGQLVIEDYAGFATSDGVLTLVPPFTDVTGHSSPGYLRMTIMTRALIMERTHGFNQPDTYACWRDFKTQVVE